MPVQGRTTRGQGLRLCQGSLAPLPESLRLGRQPSRTTPTRYPTIRSTYSGELQVWCRMTHNPHNLSLPTLLTRRE